MATTNRNSCTRCGGWPETSREIKMTADRTTVSYLFPRISAFTRTRTFIAVAAFIVGVNIGIIIANYEHRQVLSALQEKIDAIQTTINANQAKIDGMKPSAQQK
jgi:uncharacterized membrane protein (DUF106 family)